LLACLSFAHSIDAATLAVGPGKPYATPCAAIAAAADGDTIEIDAAGSYDGDVCNIPKNGLTLKGIGGRAKIDAAGKNSGGKATWVISGNDTTVESIEFSGATVPDQNGAGIRQEGNNLTVRGCYFHDNDDGILTGSGTNSQIVIEFSEFANNGFGDGMSHNMYIGNVGRFTLRYSYSHDSKIGHLVKSRAAENYILYNRVTGEQGTSSYEIDLPNAGTSYLIGNLIEQGPSTDNSSIIAYGEEGVTAGNPGHSLFVVNNTVVNDRPGGGTFVSVGGAITTAAVIRNNIFSGAGSITNQAAAVLATNFSMGNAMLVNPGAYDYHLTSGSPCINAGSDPGTGDGVPLAAIWQYVHPAKAEGRISVGAIDVGAYEFGGGIDAGVGGSIGAGGSSGGAPDAAAAGGAGGAASSDASAPGSGGQAGAGSGAGGNGVAGSAAASSADPGGCGCWLAPRSSTRNEWLALLVPAICLILRREERPRSLRDRSTHQRIPAPHRRNVVAPHRYVHQ